MANETREIIKETFIKLLEEKPLSEITVTKIAETCGINRNSFYYHYRDLPDLIEEIIREESDAVIQKYASVSSIVECFDAVTEFSSHRRRAIMHIYRSMNRETFETYLMRTCQYFITHYVRNALRDKGIDDLVEKNEAIIVNYYKCLCFGMVIDWLDSGMNEEKAQSFREVFRLKADAAEEIARVLRRREIG